MVIVKDHGKESYKGYYLNLPDGLAEILTVGCSFTVTVTVAVLEQPVAVSVTVSL